MEFGKVCISTYLVLQDNCLLAHVRSLSPHEIIPSSTLSSTTPCHRSIVPSFHPHFTIFPPTLVFLPWHSSIHLPDRRHFLRLILSSSHPSLSSFPTPPPPHFSPLPPSPRLICEQCGHSHSDMCGMLELLRRSVYWDGFDWGADGYFARG